MCLFTYGGRGTKTSFLIVSDHLVPLPASSAGSDRQLAPLAAAPIVLAPVPSSLFALAICIKKVQPGLAPGPALVLRVGVMVTSSLATTWPVCDWAISIARLYCLLLA